MDLPSRFDLRGRSIMNRREFVGLVGVGGVISALPATVTACGQQTAASDPAASVPVVAAASPRTDGFEVVGTVADLDKTGQLLNEKLAIGKALVVRSGDKLIAVDPTCTHAGCTVAWNPNQTFICPCHSSSFATDGKVLQGPASKPLGLYTAKIEGEFVLVKTVV
jgi:cytochrome b6-f complex iron-sulfur subunit